MATTDTLIYTIEVEDKASSGLDDIASGLKSLASNAKSFKSSLETMSSAFDAFGAFDASGLGAIQELFEVFEPFLEKVKEAGPALEALSAGLVKMGKDAAAAMKENETLRAELDRIKATAEGFPPIWQEVADAATKAANSMAYSGIAQGWSTLKTEAASLWESIKQGWTNATDPVYLLETAANKAWDAFKGLGNAVVWVGEQVVDTFVKGAEYVAEFTADSVAAFAKYEDSLNTARRTMGLSKEETDALGAALQDLSVGITDSGQTLDTFGNVLDENGKVLSSWADGLQGAVSTEALAEIAGIAGQMGITFQDNAAGLMEFTTTIAQTSIAFETSATEAASALAIMSKVFEQPIEEADKMAGAIAVLADTTQSSVPQIIDFMTRVGNVAAPIGMTAEEVAALGATLASSGLSMETSGTAVTNIIAKIETDYKRFEEVLAAGGIGKGMLEIAVRSKDAMGALTLVSTAINNIAATDQLAATAAIEDLGLAGSRSLTVMQTLVSKFGDFKTNLEAVSDPLKNAQALQDKYNAAVDTLNNRWNTTKNSFNTLKQVIGEELGNALAGLLEKLNPIIAVFVQWVQDSPVAQAIFKAMGEVIDYIGKVLTEVATKFVNWLTSLDASSISGQAFIDWINKAKDAVIEFIQNALEWLRTEAPGIWESIKNGVSDAFTWILTNGPDIAAVFMDAVAYAGELFALVKDAGNIWADFAAGFWDDVAKPFSWLDEQLSKVGNSFGVFGELAEKWLRIIMNPLAEILSGFENFKGILTTIGGLWDKLIGKQASVASQWQDFAAKNATPTTTTTTATVAGSDEDWYNQQLATLDKMQGTTTATSSGDTWYSEQLALLDKMQTTATSVATATDTMSTAINQSNGAIQQLTTSGQQFGDTMIYHSVLPDMVSNFALVSDAIDSATGRIGTMTDAGLVLGDTMNSVMAATATTLGSLAAASTATVASAQQAVDNYSALLNNVGILNASGIIGMTDAYQQALSDLQTAQGTSASVQYQDVSTSVASMQSTTAAVSTTPTTTSTESSSNQTLNATLVLDGTTVGTLTSTITQTQESQGRYSYSV